MKNLHYELSVKVDIKNTLYLNEAGMMADDLGYCNNAVKYYEKSK